jgi:nanoRNase/pAp phosphatase (c-di-AMP/oligoRNAs hydrolase)
VPSVINGSDQSRKFEGSLAAARGQPLVVLLSGHPDPDAIGSALAHQRICEKLDIPTTIAHVLPVSRPENRALVKLLNVNMVQVADPRDLEQYTYLSLVDTSTSESSIELPERLKLLTVVDHHRKPAKLDAAFADVRPDVGATSTIYAEYLEQLSPFSGDSVEDTRVATALMFGIETDTDDFAIATSYDFRAAAYLKPHVDTPLLLRVGHRLMAEEAMTALGRALSDLEVVRDFAFASVGRVSATNRDAIPTAADFILRREDIDTVVVFGIVEDRIDGSLRTNSASVDPALFLEAAFGVNSKGQPYGGGRADKGGFQIPLGFLSDCADSAVLLRLARQTVRKRLSRVVPGLDGDNHQ